MAGNEENVQMMTAPAPSPAYPENNVTALQRVGLNSYNISVSIITV